MILAQLDGHPVRATLGGPRAAGCRDCGGPVYAKTGSVITHHWSHYPNTERECATAGMPETEWHRGWKARCEDAERIEVAVGNRRADVLTRYGWSIEFQHSAQTREQIHTRRRDWKGRLVWCFDELEAVERKDVTWGRPPGRQFVTIQIARTKDYLFSTRTPTFLHADETTVLYVGRRHRTRRDLAYGWPLSVEQFTTHVIDGGRPPRHPVPYDTTPDLDLWSRPYGPEEVPELILDGTPTPDWPKCAGCPGGVFYQPTRRTHCARCVPVPPLLGPMRIREGAG